MKPREKDWFYKIIRYVFLTAEANVLSTQLLSCLIFTVSRPQHKDREKQIPPKHVFYTEIGNNVGKINTFISQEIAILKLWIVG